MKLLKRLLLGVFALCCAVGFAACGGGSGSKSQPDDTESLNTESSSESESSSENFQGTCEMRGYHNYVAGKCDNCEKEVTPTEYFTFSETTVDGKNGYTIRGIKKDLPTDVILPDYYEGKPVVSIGENTFSYSSFKSFKSMIIPDSVTSIGDYAFDDCGNLTSITLSDSVTSIGDSAFKNCNCLTIYCEAAEKANGWSDNWNITNTDRWEQIVCPVVWDCNNNNVADDGCVYAVVDGLRYAFKDGKATLAGQSTDIIEVNIPSTVTYESIEYSVETIADFAFYNCDKLISITIPECISTIGKYALEKCREVLTVSCEIKEKPKGWATNWNYIDAAVVWDCNNNNVADDGYIYMFLDGLRYGLKDGKANVAIQIADITTANIPSSITYELQEYPVVSIMDKAFYECDKLANITIPNSVTSIGRAAFESCISLTNITIPDSVTSIGGYAFDSCIGLTNITIPEGVTSIENYAFCDCDKLISITIPDSVTSIGEHAFFKCSSLTRVTIPDGVTSIGDLAFAHCQRLTNITLPDSVTSIGRDPFAGCSSSQYNEYDNGYYVGNEENPYMVFISVKSNDITSCTIHDKTKIIASEAFSYCRSLTSIVIPDSVTSIGEEAFRYCSSLTSVYYNGTEEQWNKISIGRYNAYLKESTRYYYSESAPTESGNYWHYDEKGQIVVW